MFTSDFDVEDLGYEDVSVYDIEVEDNHNFFGNKICVHNSIYGAIGSSKFIFYDPDVAEAITMTGQIILRQMGESVKNFINNPKNQSTAIRLYEKKIGKSICVNPLPAKCKHVFGDTDSVGFEMEELVTQFDLSEYERNCFVRWFADNLVQKCINKAMTKIASFTNAVDSSVLSADREIISPSSIFAAKKKYSMLKFDEEGAEYSEPYPQKIQGLTIIQKSTPKVCKERLRTFMEKMFYDDKEAFEYECEFRKEFESFGPDLIAKNSSISDIEKYEVEKGFIKRTPLHVKGAIAHNRLVRLHNADVSLIKSGDSIKFTYLTTPNPTGDKVIAWMNDWPDFFNDIGIQKYVDRTTQFNKIFSGQTHILYDATGFNFKIGEELDIF